MEIIEALALFILINAASIALIRGGKDDSI